MVAYNEVWQERDALRAEIERLRAETATDRSALRIATDRARVAEARLDAVRALLADADPDTWGVPYVYVSEVRAALGDEGATPAPCAKCSHPKDAHLASPYGCYCRCTAYDPGATP